MKILFVCSGNNKFGISPIVKNQGESLKENGIHLDYFTITGKGIKGYFKNIFYLKKYIKKNSYNIIHAHYLLSAIVASLAGAKPLVVSLMGSDVKSSLFFRFIIRFFHSFFWSITIVKSKEMKYSLRIKGVKVVPNGVDFNKFKPIDKKEAVKERGWDLSQKHVLFAANPIRTVKNFKLAKKAVDLLVDKKIELHYLENIPNNKVPYYYNASDVVLLTSLWEGSPNVIKEAMASNIPIVSTDVGDVREIIGETQGSYICSFDPTDVAEKIDLAFQFLGKTKGRKRIKELGLDDRIIANKLIEIYKTLIK